MKVYNLDTNLLDNNNKLDEEKLYSILKNNIKYLNSSSLENNTNNNTVNNIYNIEINNNKYLLKTLLYNQLRNADKEILNMTKINSNKLVKPYILQCKYMVKTSDMIVSIFENVNSMLISNFINNIHNLYDNAKRIKLKRYLIIGLLKATNDLHKANVCHLQINVNNILISMNNNYNENKTYTEKSPINIKFINFNLNFNNKKKKYIHVNQLKPLDPFINYNETNKFITLEEGKKYDLWCISLIIFKILLPSNIYNNLITKIISDKNFEYDISIDDEFISIYNNLKIYSLIALYKRENIDFILNKIILDEKHD
jgi:hypothetical protein